MQVGTNEAGSRTGTYNAHRHAPINARARTHAQRMSRTLAGRLASIHGIGRHNDLIEVQLNGAIVFFIKIASKETFEAIEQEDPLRYLHLQARTGA